MTLPAIPQLRMTRRLEGLYTMKASDMGADFPDAVGFVGSWRERGPVFAVPFRALVGRKYTNLLAAGRAISASDDLWDLTRVIPACALTGEAAGEAAAVAGNFHTLNIERLSVHRRAKSC